MHPKIDLAKKNALRGRNEIENIWYHNPFASIFSFLLQRFIKSERLTNWGVKEIKSLTCIWILSSETLIYLYYYEFK